MSGDEGAVRRAWVRALVAGVALAMLLPLLAGCGEPVHKQQSFVFGTLVEVTVYGESTDKARQVTNQILRDFDAMHGRLHAWQPGALDSLNTLLATAPTQGEMAPELVPLLQDAARLATRSEHLFNPAIGNLVRLWGFHGDVFEPRLPDPREVERLVAANPRMDDFEIDAQSASFLARNPAVRIDLGGYAKGWALDQAADQLRREGVENALVNIGGNIIALGTRGGRAWKVGIQHPRQAGALATLELHDGEAIGTSGDYQRYFEIDGTRYSHLIDPRNGWPVAHTQAVTVIARGPGAGTLSDVASKPLFIAGADDWLRLARQLGVEEAMRIDAQGVIAVTPSLARRTDWHPDVAQERLIVVQP